MNDIITIVDEIEKKIKQIEKIRGVIKDRGDQKAHAIADYDKALAIAIIKLKNGEKFELDGQTIQKPLATITEKVARGICWQQKLSMEQAEALYKSAVTNMDACLAQMNALQSIFRHLDNT